MQFHHVANNNCERFSSPAYQAPCILRFRSNNQVGIITKMQTGVKINFMCNFVGVGGGKRSLGLKKQMIINL